MVGEDIEPGTPKCIVRVPWECLVEAPFCEFFNSHLWQNVDSSLKEAGDIESISTILSTSIAEAATKRLLPVVVVIPEPNGEQRR